MADRSKRKGEKGALMAGVVAMLAISLIWSAVAFQAWIDVLRRDNEAEMIFRGQEIARAIQRYRRDHGGQGPQQLQDLLEPSPNKGFYYLRREYDDPLVPDGKWGLLLMGPGGTVIDPNAQPEENGLGIGLGGLGGLGGDDRDGGIGGIGGSTTPGAPGAPPGAPGAPGTTPGGLPGGTPGADGAGLLGGVGNRLNQGEGDNTSGLPIAGVRTLSEETPFRIYKGEDEYEKWHFTYLDLENPLGGPAGKGKGKGKGGLTIRPGAGTGGGARGAGGAGGAAGAAGGAPRR